ncbi:phosphate regulon transcriptional regulator PhoB [Rhodoferax sp.]|uniref:phosphate regulon transcriptional regulator PhoB n=1 Tax=Rhodoferax sp. TaxID=50421 RepID=UPI002ACDB287|nr:phosphate regulon transcriptional regulator PhoB [Rhodoferax sp.]MDZ7920571.1 phosphate regulon transcriptional regulator PhoB [Rhodoferax sp.]
MRRQPSVLVVEDESAIAELITINLRHNGYRSTWAMDGVQAKLTMDESLPDLILLDWMLPGESGLELARRWRSAPRTKKIPIIILTARGEETDRVAGLNVGADDYIAKPFSVKELLARIRAVLRRTKPEPVQEPLSVGQLSLDPLTHRVLLDGRSLKMGPTEFKLLLFLMGNAERVHSRNQLLDKVWGDNVYIGERTVDVHVKRLRQSLEQAGNMVETVHGVGYRLTVSPEKLPQATDLA